METDYQPETYWDAVAERIAGREAINIIAGDDEPYYRYKRECFLALFHTIDFSNKDVLEVGCGPGGNLYVLTGKNCKSITGVDISGKMIALAQKLLKSTNIPILKVNGTDLPFEDSCFDIVFTSTVLQHNTNETELLKLVKEIGRISKKEIILFERIEKTEKGHRTNMGRPAAYYCGLLQNEGYELMALKFLPVQVSYYICGVIRKLFNSGKHEEGQPVSKTAKILEHLILPLTKVMDKMAVGKRDVAMLHFKKKD